MRPCLKRPGKRVKQCVMRRTPSSALASTHMHMHLYDIYKHIAHICTQKIKSNGKIKIILVSFRVRCESSDKEVSCDIRCKKEKKKASYKGDPIPAVRGAASGGCQRAAFHQTSAAVRERPGDHCDGACVPV